MAVPTSPIDLADVITALGLSSTATLQDCVNAANSGGFDSAYQSSSDPLTAPYDLLDFRNYTHNITPSEPSNLSSGDITSTYININWDAASDPDGTIDHYIIYMYDPVEGFFSQHGTTTNTYYNATGLIAETQYSFYVTAVDNDGAESNGSNYVTVTTDAVMTRLYYGTLEAGSTKAINGAVYGWSRNNYGSITPDPRDTQYINWTPEGTDFMGKPIPSRIATDYPNCNYIKVGDTLYDNGQENVSNPFQLLKPHLVYLYQ